MAAVFWLSCFWLFRHNTAVTQTATWNQFQGGLKYDFFADQDDDGAVSPTEFDVMCDAITNHEASYDFDRDGAVDRADYLSFITDYLKTSPGDTDLDGQASFRDFLTLSESFGASGSWSQGDFDCSGTVDFADFLVLSGNFGEGRRLASTPEPKSCGLPLLLVMMLVAMRNPIRISQASQRLLPAEDQ